MKYTKEQYNRILDGFEWLADKTNQKISNETRKVWADEFEEFGIAFDVARRKIREASNKDHPYAIQWRDFFREGHTLLDEQIMRMRVNEERAKILRVFNATENDYQNKLTDYLINKEK